MDWIKLHTHKWLYGSGRTMTAEQRGVWADLLALAGETKFRDGSLRFDVDSPMPRAYIAGVLRIPPELLDGCIEVFNADMNISDGLPRVAIWDDGTIMLNNFNGYQSVPTDKQKLDTRGLELYERGQLRRLTNKYPDEHADALLQQIMTKDEESDA